MEYSEATIDQAEIIKGIIDAVLAGMVVQIYKESAWCDTGDDPDLMLALQYPCRVKPEPKYISFDFSDAKDLIGKAVKNKDGSLFLITTFTIVGFEIGNTAISFNNLFENFTFLDGSPCGKLSNK